MMSSMRFYSRVPRRRALQVAADVFVLIWIVAWWSIAQAVGAAIRAAAGPVDRAAVLGRDIELQLAEAANQAGGVPVVGRNLRQPFDNLAATVADLTGTTTGLSGTIEQTAAASTLILFLAPVLILIAVWLPRRVRFVRQSREVLALLAAGNAADLLALRALSSQPLPRLMTVAPDPVLAWRTGDPDVIARLADLELSSAGVARPTST